MSLEPEPADSAPRGGEGRKPARSGRARLFSSNPAWGAASAVLTGVAGAGLLVNGARGVIGAATASAWLQEQGVKSAFRVERLDASGFTGAVRLGDPNDPDLVSDHVELAFTPSLTLRSAKLVEPRLKARFDGRRLTFGALQPLIDRALAGKPAGGPGPDITVDRGLAVVQTPLGQVRLRADGRFAQGRLTNLDAHILPTELSGAEFSAKLTGGHLVAQGVPGGVKAQLNLHVAKARYGVTGVQQAVVQADLDGGGSGLIPTGPMRLSGRASSERLQVGSATASKPSLAWRYRGTATGPLNQLDLDGDGTAILEAATVAVPGRTRMVSPTLTLASDAFHLARQGERTRLQIPLTLNGRADSVELGGATLVDAAASGRWRDLTLSIAPTSSILDGVGEARVVSRRARFTATELADTSVRASGGLKAASDGQARFQGALQLEAGTPADQAWRWTKAIPLIAPQLARALAHVSVTAPQATLVRGDGGGVTLSAGAPIRIRSTSGATLSLTPEGSAPLLRLADGAASGRLDAALDGGGLPQVRLTAATYTLSQDAGGLAGAVGAALRVTGDLGPAHGLELKGAGQIERRRGVATARLDGCADIELATLSTVAKGVSAAVCSTSEPLLRADADGWRAAAELRNAQGMLPTAQVALAGAAQLQAHGGASGLAGEIDLTRLDARDLSPKRRFEPISASGQLDLADAGWRGRLKLASAKGRALGTAEIEAALDLARGEVRLDTGLLTFAQDGFQPSSISALAPTWLAKVEGPARFTGRIAWRGGSVDTSGRLQSSGLNFTGPLGRVAGARGAIDFSSLLPLATPPGQTLTADSVAWIAPLSQVQVRFQLQPRAMTLEKAAGTVSSGRVSLDQLVISLAPGATTQGVLHLAAVDIGDLIARSSLADKLTLQARLSGTIPFSIGPQGMRFTHGQLAADGPGRLSINPKALTSGSLQTSTIQTFAYQALENLAFDELNAAVDSQPKGRLGVLFHINGRHDPPKHVEARVSLFDLLAGHALDKPLPLPSGTPVNLTLDTSLNFDDLLAAYRQVGRARSEGVQDADGH